MHVKIKIRTIIWFVLAATFLLGTVLSVSAEHEHEWTDAVLVSDGLPRPEYEGKLVAVPGRMEMLKGATDEQFGILFSSPYVRRSVERLKVTWDDPDYQRVEVPEGEAESGLDTRVLTGRVAIGMYELDSELIAMLGRFDASLEREELGEELISRMEEVGSVIERDNNYYFSMAGDQIPPGPNMNYWTQNGKTNAEFDKAHPDGAGAARLIHWNKWEFDPEQDITILGVQRGNTLVKADIKQSSYENRILTKEELGNPAGDGATIIGGIAFALVCALMGVRSMRKAKREG